MVLFARLEWWYLMLGDGRSAIVGGLNTREKLVICVWWPRVARLAKSI